MSVKSVAEKIDQANEKVIGLMQSSDPYWIGMRPAIEVVPNMREGADPPLRAGDSLG